MGWGVVAHLAIANKKQLFDKRAFTPIILGANWSVFLKSYIKIKYLVFNLQLEFRKEVLQYCAAQVNLISSQFLLENLKDESQPKDTTLKTHPHFLSLCLSLSLSLSLSLHLVRSYLKVAFLC